MQSRAKENRCSQMCRPPVPPVRWHRVRKPDRRHCRSIRLMALVTYTTMSTVKGMPHPWRQLIRFRRAPSSDLIHTPEATSRLADQHLHYELLLIPHSDEIIGEAHQERASCYPPAGRGIQYGASPAWPRCSDPSDDVPAPDYRW